MFSVKGLLEKSNFLAFCKFAKWLKNCVRAWAPQVEANQYIKSQTMLVELSKNKQTKKIFYFLEEKESTRNLISHK